jgi:hypothetical protein
MEENNFIQADNTMINTKNIHWIRRINDCLEICTRTDGCILGRQTHRLCKNNKDEFDKLNKLFKKI